MQAHDAFSIQALVLSCPHDESAARAASKTALKQLRDQLIERDKFETLIKQLEEFLKQLDKEVATLGGSYDFVELAEFTDEEVRLLN